jgi:hypothetical protein
MFTTNLAKPLKDEQLKALAMSQVNYYNISLNTFNRELYAHIMQTNNSNFFNNLDRLSKIYKEINGTNIRFITMILKDNFDELHEIITKANELFHPEVHELRHYHLGEMDYVNQQALDIYHVNAKVKEIKESFPHIRYLDENAFVVLKESVENKKSVTHNRQRHYKASINSDGTMIINATGKSFNVAMLEDPLSYVTDRIIELEIMEAELYKDDIERFQYLYNGQFQARIIEFIISHRKFAYIKGCITLEDINKEKIDELYIYIKAGVYEALYKTSIISAKDGIFKSIINLEELHLNEKSGFVDFYIGICENKALRLARCWSTIADNLI